jgi:hypothetical protein
VRGRAGAVALRVDLGAHGGDLGRVAGLVAARRECGARRDQGGEDDE